ncbi:MAG TPA: DUF2062 domain-containing protein [Elainellaceae cyanobacterium]
MSQSSDPSDQPKPHSSLVSHHSSSTAKRRKTSEPKWRRRIRYIYFRFIRMRGTSQAIARGLASGVFAGWFPLFGLQTIIGVALAAVFRGNKIMAAAGTWVSNPFTYVPIYYFNFRIGEWLLERVGISVQMPGQDFQKVIADAGWQAFQQFVALGAGFIATLFLGCFTVGILSAIGAYFLGLAVVQRIRQRRSKRSTRKLR